MKILLALLLSAPSLVFAHGTKVEMVEAATSTALDKFATEESKVTVDAFNAVKSWVSGSQIKVKIYYNANANTIDYVCEMMHHDGNEMMMCSK
ncbi:MAG: hypothetical protein KDD35_10280 [Bdellovibrionales bacterium]|nr:hypothetical protein [Bdellovibrionales bacterium]